MLVRGVSLGESMVLMEKLDFEVMLRSVEKYRVTYMSVSPPLVVAMAKSELAGKYDLSSLQMLGCGGAPLGKEVAERFVARFPGVEIVQVILLFLQCCTCTIPITEKHIAVEVFLYFLVFLSSFSL